MTCDSFFRVASGGIPEVQDMVAAPTRKCFPISTQRYLPHIGSFNVFLKRASVNIPQADSIVTRADKHPTITTERHAIDGFLVSLERFLLGTSGDIP